MEKPTIDQIRTKIDEVISYHRADVKRRLAIVEFIEKHRSIFEEHLVAPTHYPQSVDIDNPSREDALALMKAFGGKWTKNVNGVNVDYWQKIGDAIVRLWSTPPPPSCRVVEVEEIVPAKPEEKVIRKRLVCTNGSSVEESKDDLI